MDLNNLDINTLDNLNIDTSAADAIIAANKKAIAEAAAVTKVQAKTKTPAATQAKVVAPVIVEPELISVEGALEDLMELVSETDVADMQLAVEEEFTARREFEIAKGAGEQKLKNLDGYLKRLLPVSIITLLAATNVSVSFINRQQGSNRYNVYAIDKFADLTSALATGYMRNAVNIAIMKSMFACRKEGFAFTKELALASTSSSVRIDEKIRKVLTRHTVSEKTMDTQMSSTMSALEILGVVENYGPRNSKVWRLTDTPQTRKMEALLAA